MPTKLRPTYNHGIEITIEIHSGARQIERGWYNGKGWQLDNEPPFDWKPIAWRKIQKPYKG